MDSTAASPLTPPVNALPPGTRLGEFELLDVLGLGGFGIVYRAFDHALEREVAIKEYMPAMLAGRTETLHVSLRSQSDAEVFEAGRRSFVNEAKLLARFDHPSLVKVYRFWEANDTAYMAMPIYRGHTLKVVRQQMAGAPDEPWLRALLTPLLSALERLHGEGVYHRDIAPDNILIEPDGRPVLLDFGAARRVIGDRSQNLTAILKPAFAPIEQYAEASSARQGPWTDLYALGATLHFALTGQAPPPATTRMLHDDLAPLASRGLPGCSTRFLQAVDWMLATRPADRPQSVSALRAVLDGTATAPLPPAAPPPAAWEPTRPQPPLPAAGSAPATIDLPLEPPPAPAPAAAPAPATWPGDRGVRRVLPAALGVVALAGAAALWWWPRAPAPQAVAGPAASAGPAAPPVVAASTPPAPVQAAAPGAPVQVAAPASAPAAGPPAVSRPAPPVLPVLVARPARVEPAPEVTRPAPQPAEAQAPRPAAAAPPPAEPRPAALSDDPSALCGKRVLVAQLICMERQCRKPDLAQHPACRKWYAQANRPQP